jgi:hypothetical protein
MCPLRLVQEPCLGRRLRPLLCWDTRLVKTSFQMPPLCYFQAYCRERS